VKHLAETVTEGVAKVGHCESRRKGFGWSKGSAGQVRGCSLRWGARRGERAAVGARPQGRTKQKDEESRWPKTNLLRNKQGQGRVWERQHLYRFKGTGPETLGGPKSKKIKWGKHLKLGTVSHRRGKKEKTGFP